MVASTDPVLLVVLVVVVASLLLALRAGHRRRAVDARLLAHATGHPSAGHPRGMTVARRAAVASDVADQLIAAGLDVVSLPGTVVAARGLDGQYQLDVLPDCIVTSYLTNAGVLELGRFAGTVAAVHSVTEHARLSLR